MKDMWKMLSSLHAQAQQFILVKIIHSLVGKSPFLNSREAKPKKSIIKPFAPMAELRGGKGHDNVELALSFIFSNLANFKGDILENLNQR